MSNITRNNISLVYGPKEKGRGASKGEVYQGFVDLDKKQLSEIIQFLSENKAKDLLVAFLNKSCIGWSNEATNEDTGEFNSELFEQLASGMSVRSESKADLEAKLEELVGQLTSDEGMLWSDSVRMEKIGEIRDLRVAIESKKRERKPKVAAEAAVPA